MSTYTSELGKKINSLYDILAEFARASTIEPFMVDPEPTRRFAHCVIRLVYKTGVWKTPPTAEELINEYDKRNPSI